MKLLIGTFTKGDLMKALYTEKELRNVDAAIPLEFWEQVDSTSWYVMDYNDRTGTRDHNVFGKLTDLRHKAIEREVVLLKEPSGTHTASELGALANYLKHAMIQSIQQLVQNHGTAIEVRETSDISGGGYLEAAEGIDLSGDDPMQLAGDNGEYVQAVFRHPEDGSLQVWYENDGWQNHYPVSKMGLDDLQNLLIEVESRIADMLEVQNDKGGTSHE